MQGSSTTCSENEQREIYQRRNPSPSPEGALQLKGVSTMVDDLALLAQRGPKRPCAAGSAGQWWRTASCAACEVRGLVMHRTQVLHH